MISSCVVAELSVVKVKEGQRGGKREKRSGNWCERRNLGDLEVGKDHVEGLEEKQEMESKRSGAGVCFPSGW